MSLSLTHEEKSSASSRLNRDRRLAKAISFSMSGKLLRKSWSGGRSDGGSGAIGGYTGRVIREFERWRILTQGPGSEYLSQAILPERVLGRVGSWNRPNGSV